MPGDGALVPSCVTTNPLTSSLLFFPSSEAFAWGGDVLLLLFEPHPPSGGHYCRAAPTGTAPRDIPFAVPALGAQGEQIFPSRHMLLLPCQPFPSPPALANIVLVFCLPSAGNREVWPPAPWHTSKAHGAAQLSPALPGPEEGPEDYHQAPALRKVQQRLNLAACRGGWGTRGALLPAHLGQA